MSCQFGDKTVCLSCFSGYLNHVNYATKMKPNFSRLVKSVKMMFELLN